MKESKARDQSSAASDRRSGDIPISALEMVQVNEAVTAVNVESLMPPDWQRQMHDVVNRHGKFVELAGGAVSTSIEPSTFITAYSVVKGQDIETSLPWLWKLYQGPFLELVSQVAGEEVEVDQDKDFNANINTLTKKDQRDGYERHRDFNPWTALLAVTTMHEGDGGELFHILPDGTRKETRIQAGWLYIFDGKNHFHGVNKLNPDGGSDVRITVPMDYRLRGVPVERSRDMGKIFGEKNGGK